MITYMGKKRSQAWTPERIRQLRLSRGLNQVQFAERLKLRQGQITKLETGKIKPSLAVAHLLDLFNQDVI